MAGWAPVLGFAAVTLGSFGLVTPALRAHPQNWIQTNVVRRGKTKPVGLIESFGAPPQPRGGFLVATLLLGTPPPDHVGALPQTPFRGSAPDPVGAPPQTPFGGSAQTLLGLNPKPIWWLRQDSVGDAPQPRLGVSLSRPHWGSAPDPDSGDCTMQSFSAFSCDNTEIPA